MIGPKIKPRIQPGDYHLVVNDTAETVKCYSSTGKLLWTKPALAKGVNGPTTWNNGGDTPPGLYRIGTLYRSEAGESKEAVWYPYGPLCWDLEEQENQENVRGRAGICLHGGGSAAPNPLADYQPLYPTHGCIRMHNRDTVEFILPLTHKWDAKRGWVRRGNNVWVSVWQDYE